MGAMNFVCMMCFATTSRGCPCFSWLQALAHKNLVDFYTVNGSDHYPVLADYALIKSSTADDIPPFDDGTGDLDIVEEGPGGSGEWGTDVVPES